MKSDQRVLFHLTNVSLALGKALVTEGDSTSVRTTVLCFIGEARDHRLRFMSHRENYFLPWAEAESFPEFSCPLPGPGPCSPEGLEEVDTGVERTVSEGTYLLGVEKPE